MKILAAQLKDQQIIVALLCPGQVKTRMDFGNSDVEIDNSVVAMRGLIERMTPASSGTFTRYNGETIAW
jgi:short-subunit dehydrogenase